jgi:serine/threonine protein phosphatase PrpC
MIPVEKADFSFYAVTHPGKAGKNNEDNYLVSTYELSESDKTSSLVAIIADGVGGHQAGEIAARMAVEEISQVIGRSDASRPLTTLEEAFFQANKSIYSQSNRGKDFIGMSTTAACAWLIGRRLYLASVGDSRIYLRRDDHIQQLTTDHTWIQEAIESGLLTPEQARNHPNAHLIRRHLGSQQPAITDFRLRLSPDESDAKAFTNQGMRLRPSDHLLLCSCKMH